MSENHVGIYTILDANGSVTDVQLHNPNHKGLGLSVSIEKYINDRIKPHYTKLPTWHDVNGDQVVGSVQIVAATDLSLSKANKDALIRGELVELLNGDEIRMIKPGLVEIKDHRSGEVKKYMLIGLY